MSDRLGATNVDVVVIGAGISGLAVAAAAAGSMSVVVCEAESQPAQHTSGRSAATFIDWYGGPAVAPFTRASRDWFASDAEGDAASPLLRRRGLLTVAQPSDEPPDASHGEPISAGEAVELLPALRPELVAAARFDPDVFDIDVAEAIAVLRRRFVRDGGSLALGSPVVELRRAAGAWHLRAGERRMSATTVVNASGAWADHIAALAGLPPRDLQPMRRTMFTFRASAEAEPWPMVFDAAERYYFKPDGTQLMASPADETPEPPGDPRPEELDVAMAIDAINEATTLQIRSITSSWAGQRTFAPDRRLVVGPDPQEPSFVWCAGQGGAGIQVAPAVGRTVAALIDGSPLPVDAEAMAACRPDR